jgi:light-harvesting protein B-800-850 beta chain
VTYALRRRDQLVDFVEVRAILPLGAAPACRFSTENIVASNERYKMADQDDPTRVWPTGLTLPEAEELHRHVIDGARIFFAIAAFAHILAFAFSPWLK